MNRLYSQCDMDSRPAIPDDIALRLIHRAVKRRVVLVHGDLNKGRMHCAMGALFADVPEARVRGSLAVEIADFNDSIPVTATNRQRRNKVEKWLRGKIKALPSN